MILYLPSKEEAAHLLTYPRQLGSLAIVEGALPPSFILEPAVTAAASPWLMPRLFCDEASRQIVGAGGFKSAPTDGAIELGYHVAPSCRQRGYATAAVALLAEEALANALVLTLAAKVSLKNGASQRVLQKCGFHCDGIGDDHGIPAQIWIRRRPDAAR